MFLEPDLTPRQLRKARKEHPGLRAEYTKARWWKIESGWYTVLCSCGWEDPERIPVYASVEGSGMFVADLSINLAMNRHLETVYGRRT